jgi:hypothetical protein
MDIKTLNKRKSRLDGSLTWLGGVPIFAWCGIFRRHQLKKTLACHISSSLTYAPNIKGSTESSPRSLYDQKLVELDSAIK